MLTTFEPIAAPRRQEIIRFLWNRDRSAGEIHRSMPDVTFGAVSQHLRILREAGVVAQRGEGRSRVYSVRKEELGPFKDMLERMWSSSLYRLKIRAEMEERRRGPKPTRAEATRLAPKKPNRKRKRP